MEKLWTTAEVAKHLAIGEDEVERLARVGKLTGYKLGGRFLRFRPDQVKSLKQTLQPRQKTSAPPVVEHVTWQERLKDFFYFYDFYILSAALLLGIVFYLMASG